MIVAHTLPTPPAVPQPGTRTCPSGVYGLAGDWGPGSLMSNTGYHRALIRLEYPLRGERIIHHIRPEYCK